MKPSFDLLDRVKVQAILEARKINKTSMEVWARSTFRHPMTRSAGMPPIESAPAHYKSAVLPEALKVPAFIPAANRLTMNYILPYYVLDGALFNLHLAFPMAKDVPWSPDALAYEPFPAHPEGWTSIQDDQAFTALRIQGPNPFLLTRTADGRFEVDYGPYFQGIIDPVVCGFRLAGEALVPDWIRIGEATHRPGEAGWERAKFVANGLDARFTVFLRHLEHTHLITGQSYSLSALGLPTKHPVRAFLDFFTFGTLVVNDFAFKLLVTPASYFLQSSFVTAAQVQTMFANFVPTYRLEQLIPPKDIAARGIDQIPGHPYVEHAPRIWGVITDFVRGYVGRAYADDAAVRSDAELQRWYTQLLTLLPNHDPVAEPLETIERLVETLAVVVYLNVSHEICGDFSPYSMSNDPAHKKLIDFSNVLTENDQPPRASDVFMFDQGAYAGRFDNGGNFLMTLDAKAQILDPALREAVEGFQGALRGLDEEIAARNRTRAIPFLRLQPHRWKASISY